MQLVWNNICSFTTYLVFRHCAVGLGDQQSGLFFWIAIVAAVLLYPVIQASYLDFLRAFEVFVVYRILAYANLVPNIWNKTKYGKNISFSDLLSAVFFFLAETRESKYKLKWKFFKNFLPFMDKIVMYIIRGKRK